MDTTNYALHYTSTGSEHHQQNLKIKLLEPSTAIAMGQQKLETPRQAPIYNLLLN
jgi:hypothetical protein